MESMGVQKNQYFSNLGTLDLKNIGIPFILKYQYWYGIQIWGVCELFGFTNLYGGIIFKGAGTKIAAELLKYELL